MPGFSTVGRVADAYLEGRTHFCAFRKVLNYASTAGSWIDLSMAPGNPRPNYYASTPLTAATLDAFDGIFHGAAKAPATKHLASLSICAAASALTGAYTLADYLLYYPFIAGDEPGVQTMSNTVTLPRYTDGAGVQVMAVAVAPTTGGGTFTFNYVNQDGVARTSPAQGCIATACPAGQIVTNSPGLTTSSPGPFLRLSAGDTGVRSITSVTFSVASGGLICLALVKPLADIVAREANVFAEKAYGAGMLPLPAVVDGAYLNLIHNPTSATAANNALTGCAHFIWSA